MNSEGFKETEIGFIPKNWEVRELSSLGKIITGKTPPTKEKDNFGPDYPFITPRDMKGQKFILKTERYLSEKGKNSVKNCFLPEGSICVSCIGSDMGKVVMNKRPSITNQQLNSIVVDKINPEFVYYALLNISTRLKDLAHSTAVPIINKKYFSMTKIALPSNLTEIDNITAILSSLDAKIENNNQMNSTLEAIGQSIFLHWFVNYEFPNENGQPYKSSGGEMVNSELGEIPGGWNVVKASDAIEINPKLKVDRKSEKIHVPMTGLSKTSMVITEFQKRKGSSGAKFQNYDTLFARITPSTEHGKTAFIQFLKPDETAIGSTEFIVLRSRTLNPYYVYCLARYENFRKHAINSMTGTSGRQRVQNECFNDYYIAQPDEKTLCKFADLMEPLFNQIHVQSNENQNMAEIRDSILPKLMSGRIRVKGSD